jgi:hypothetical protein
MVNVGWRLASRRIWMATSNFMVGRGAPDPELAAQEERLRRSVEALDLDARRASLDAGEGLTGDDLLDRVLAKRGLSRAPSVGS